MSRKTCSHSMMKSTLLSFYLNYIVKPLTEILKKMSWRTFFACMVQLKSCWRTPPLENGREDKSQFLGNKCQKFCQEIHFVFQLYKCLVFITMRNNLLFNGFTTIVMMKAAVWQSLNLCVIHTFLKQLGRLSLSNNWQTSF